MKRLNDLLGSPEKVISYSIDLVCLCLILYGLYRHFRQTDKSTMQASTLHDFKRAVSDGNIFFSSQPVMKSGVTVSPTVHTRRRASSVVSDLSISEALLSLHVWLSLLSKVGFSHCITFGNYCIIVIC